MNLYAVVKRKRKTRKGRGFSRAELREVALNPNEALKLAIPIDTRRSTKYENNVATLKAYIHKLKLKPVVQAEKRKIIALTAVKGIGSKTAEKLTCAGITNANELAFSTRSRVAEALGSSEDRASRFIEAARSLLTEGEFTAG